MKRRVISSISGRRVDDLVGRDAGERAAEDDARGVAARLGGLQADRLEAAPDLGHVLDADPVVLDVLPVADVGGAAGELVAEVGLLTEEICMRVLSAAIGLTLLAGSAHAGEVTLDLPGDVDDSTVTYACESGRVMEDARH